MMEILRTGLMVVLVLNCLVLILLVLIQLPKKEAGAGLAFGAGAADALLGAGSGNALTQLTKYAATCFLGLSLGLGILNSKAAHSSQSEVRKSLANQPKVAPVPAPAAKPASQFQSLASTNLLVTPAVAGTNAAAPIAVPPAPAAATTNK